MLVDHRPLLCYWKITSLIILVTATVDIGTAMHALFICTRAYVHMLTVYKGVVFVERLKNSVEKLFSHTLETRCYSMRLEEFHNSLILS